MLGTSHGGRCVALGGLVLYKFHVKGGVPVAV